MEVEPEVSKRHHLFDAYGIELEYMLVDRDTLDVKPITDRLFHDIAGAYVNEIDRGSLAWSNELALHVIELKTNGPVSGLSGLHELFQQDVCEINAMLRRHNAKLMPGAMHPWMNPDEEMALWPHEYNPIYEAYHRIFNCRGHGWANLQSTHINLAFANDEEFERLHAAIRVLLPILPGLAASSPIADLQMQPQRNYRLEVYRTNSLKVPSVTGHVIPEAVFSEKEYNDFIFKPMYRDIEPHDPNKILQEEWLNSRGAIARFDRGSIEIRVMDIQECPMADMAIIRLISDVLRALVHERWSSLEEQKAWNEQKLFHIFMSVVEKAETTLMEDQDYSLLFGYPSAGKAYVSDLWQYLFEQLYTGEQIKQDIVLKQMERMLEHGTLSTRISRELSGNFSKHDAMMVYGKLCECLEEGKLFGIDG